MLAVILTALKENKNFTPCGIYNDNGAYILLYFFLLQNYRCTFRRSPSSSLTSECIAAMAEGLNPSLYKYFLGLLWGDDDSTYLAKADLCADSEWESFCNVITKLCQNPIRNSQLSHSSWEFLVKSKYNQQYLRSNYVAGAFPGLLSNSKESDSSAVTANHTENTDGAFCMKLLTETLDSLHAVYETLKLDNLRKRCDSF